MKTLLDSPKKPFQLYRKSKRRYKMTMTKRGDQLWACGECGALHYSWNWKTGAPGDKDTRQRAVNCCKQQYCECGNKIDSGYIGPKCSPCNSFARDTLRLAKAVEIKDCDGPIYCENLDRYWSDIGDFLDWLACEIEDEEDDSIPEWVHPCTTKSFGSLDASSIIENELTEHYEDAFDRVNDLDGLQAFLDDWVAKQSIESWEADLSKKISVKNLVEQIKK